MFVADNPNKTKTLMGFVVQKHKLNKDKLNKKSEAIGFVLYLLFICTLI